MNPPDIELADQLADPPTSNIFTNPILIWKALFFCVLIPVVGIYYAFLTVPFLEGSTDVAPVVFDSRTYMLMANDFPGLEGWALMVLTNRNLAGPLTLLNMLGNNSFAVLIFNLFLFYFCLNIFFKSARYRMKYFFIALVANPLMLSSLTSINKEVLSVCALLVVLAYSFTNMKRHLALALLLSLLVRQELTILFIAFAVGRKIRSSFGRTVLLLIAVLALSATLPFIDTNADLLTANQTDKSVGISVFLSTLTDHFLYFIAVLPKIFLNLFGDIKLIIADQEDYGFSAWSGILFIIAGVAARKRFHLFNDPYFLFISYAILFATPSFIHHRYFFPSYVILLTLVFFDSRNPAPRVMSPVIE